MRNQSIVTTAANRWRATRFPIRERVQYVLFQQGADLRGTGTTLNVSSSGLQFTTDQPLPVGHQIEVAVDWPAELEGGCPLKFVGTGRVVRSGLDRVAVKIYKYEFRTRAKSRTSGVRDSPHRPAEVLKPDRP
jgi:hypothetical protein